jgi:acetyl esterase/lipase
MDSRWRLAEGFAVASLNYRLTRHAAFPSQIYDCKAAIRYLRKHADQYGLAKDRFGAWGSSAGGHLVALLGTSGDVSALEGDLGEKDVSSRVQAVCDWFGPTDLLRMNPTSSGSPRQGEDPAAQPIAKLLGGLIQDKQVEARMASPATYVTKDDPPFLIMHGHTDPLVPLEQSITLHDLLRQSGVECELIVVEGAGHAFFSGPQELQLVSDFFQRHLKPVG